MFSLRNLARQAVAASGAAPAAPGRDDSGLIDLAALAAREEVRDTPHKLEVSPFLAVGLFDVPAPAPAPPPPSPAAAPSRTLRPRTLALAAGALAILVAGAAVAGVLARASQDPAPLPVDPVAAITAPVTPPSEPKVETPPPAAPPPVATVAKPPAGPATGLGKGTTRQVPRPPTTLPPKVEPPKTEAPCDLMCQMQKSVARPR